MTDDIKINISIKSIKTALEFYCFGGGSAYHIKRTVILISPCFKIIPHSTLKSRQSKSVIFCNHKESTIYDKVIVGGAKIWKALKNCRIK